MKAEIQKTAAKAVPRYRRPEQPGTKEVFPWSDQFILWGRRDLPDRQRHARPRAPRRTAAASAQSCSSSTLLERLGDSVERAEAKGATNILALDRSLAFIVNVPNNRVITALSEAELRDSIFTNIDGAVFL